MEAVSIPFLLYSPSHFPGLSTQLFLLSNSLPKISINMWLMSLRSLTRSRWPKLAYQKLFYYYYYFFEWKNTILSLLAFGLAHSKDSLHNMFYNFTAKWHQNCWRLESLSGGESNCSWHNECGWLGKRHYSDKQRIRCNESPHSWGAH